jgi:hypothetical protein
MILIEYVSALNAVTIKIILKNVFFLILEIIFKDHGLSLIAHMSVTESWFP